MTSLSQDRPVTFDDVREAAAAIGSLLPPTAAWSYPALNEVAGCEVVVKHENTQPTGAFKVRGGVALLADLATTGLPRGFVTASTGNHAQSVAFAARRAELPAVVVMPLSAPQSKADTVRLLGAEVVRHGPTMTEAAEFARSLAATRSLTYVDPGNTAAIIAGHATVYLELFSQHPNLQVVYVPIGSGTGAAGACIVRDQLAPSCRIVGVQSSQAPAAYWSWRDGQIRTIECRTRHSGLATGRGFELPQSILAAGLSDFLLVDDDHIDDATSLLARRAHTLCEGAGSAALAGLLADSARPACETKCAVVCTGGNASEDDLRAVAS